MENVRVCFHDDDFDLIDLEFESPADELVEEWILSNIGKMSENFVIFAGNVEIWRYSSGIPVFAKDLSQFFDHVLTIYDVTSRKYRIFDQLNRSYKSATEHLAEYFVKTSLIHVDVVLNGFPLVSMVDTGAQMSIISKSTAEKCELMERVDTRFKVDVAGVGGMQEAVGRILDVNILINGTYLPTVLTVLHDHEISSDMIIGIDFLRSYQAFIDLKNQKIILNGKEKFVEAPIVSENVIQKSGIRVFGVEQGIEK